jgi:hypothetical protein
VRGGLGKRAGEARRLRPTCVARTRRGLKHIRRCSGQLTGGCARRSGGRRAHLVAALAAWYLSNEGLTNSSCAQSLSAMKPAGRRQAAAAAVVMRAWAGPAPAASAPSQGCALTRHGAPHAKPARCNGVSSEAGSRACELLAAAAAAAGKPASAPACRVAGCGDHADAAHRKRLACATATRGDGRCQRQQRGCKRRGSTCGWPALASQRGVVSLLHGGVESIHVHVEPAPAHIFFPLRWRAASAPRSSSAASPAPTAHGPRPQAPAPGPTWSARAPPPSPRPARRPRAGAPRARLRPSRRRPRACAPRAPPHPPSYAARSGSGASPAARVRDSLLRGAQRSMTCAGARKEWGLGGGAAGRRPLRHGSSIPSRSCAAPGQRALLIS